LEGGKEEIKQKENAQRENALRFRGEKASQSVAKVAREFRKKQVWEKGGALWRGIRKETKRKGTVKNNCQGCR